MCDILQYFVEKVKIYCFINYTTENLLQHGILVVKALPPIPEFESKM